jgi:hypothetical protein
MTYSIHTFELTLDLDKEEYSELLISAHHHGKSIYRKNGKYLDGYLRDKANKGIKIEHHNNIYKKNIKFIVNPSRVLGGHDSKLWKPSDKNIDKLLHRLDEHIEDYFDAEFTLNDFRLTRVDFTANVDVGSREYVSAYIKVLHRIGKVKGFSLKYKKNYVPIDKNLSFDLTGNSNNIEFTAYNKEAESGSKDFKGILRVEVRLTKQKAIRKRTDKENTSKQIRDLARRSREIFMETFERVVPAGTHYRKGKAVEMIKASDLKNKKKEKMLRLIELIAEKKSLLLAQKALEVRDIDQVMGWFSELDLSPVTIGKRTAVKELESLYRYL